MAGIFYELGRLAGPAVRKARWVWSAAAGSEDELIAAERAAGADLAREVLSQHRRCADAPLVERLTDIGGALVGRLKDKRRTFEFYGLSGEQPQAFCLPGGFVFITRGMVDLCSFLPDRIAFVLAHEIAHVVEGHALQRMAGRVLLRAGALRAMPTGKLGALAAEFIGKAYSRDQERTADRFGLRLMRAAGFDGQAAVAVFEKLAALNPSDKRGGYFATHPDATDRIAELKRLLKEWTKQ